MSEIHPEQDYVRFLEEGRFMIQQCTDSDRYIFYPRVVEPVTGSTRLHWVEPSGRGTVYATTVIHKKPPAANINVVLVDLEEGPRMMSRVDGIPAGDVRIGMTVQARVIRENDQPLVIFEPV